MKTLADTKAKIMENFESSFHPELAKDPAMIKGNVRHFLSSAIDQTVESVLEEVKMEKKAEERVSLYGMDDCSYTENEEWNQAVSELQERIKKLKED